MIITDVELVMVLTFQLFAILNPMAVTPVLLSMTDQLEAHQRRFIVIRSTIIVMILSIGILFLGRAFLELLGVPISSFRFAGGLLFLLSALRTFMTETTKESTSQATMKAKEVTEVELTEIAAVPLALPLLLGPGTITLILTLSTNYPLLPVFMAIIIAVLLSGAFLLSSNIMMKLLKPIGIRILARLMALVVASVGIEFIHQSLIDWGIAAS